MDFGGIWENFEGNWDDLRGNWQKLRESWEAGLFWAVAVYNTVHTVYMVDSILGSSL